MTNSIQALVDVCISYIPEELLATRPDVIDTLERTAEQFLLKLIPYDKACAIFSKLINFTDPIDKMNAILQIEADPIPPPKDYNMNDSKNNNLRRKTRAWTSYEDQRLLAGVYRNGIENWTAISYFVGNGRTRSQCSQRWYRVIDPTIRKDKWTKEEEERLIQVIDKSGDKSWTLIASKMGNRSDVQCRYKYKQLQKELAKDGLILKPSAQDSNSIHVDRPAIRRLKNLVQNVEHIKSQLNSSNNNIININMNNNLNYNMNNNFINMNSPHFHNEQNEQPGRMVNAANENKIIKINNGNSHDINIKVQEDIRNQQAPPIQQAQKVVYYPNTPPFTKPPQFIANSPVIINPSQIQQIAQQIPRMMNSPQVGNSPQINQQIGPQTNQQISPQINQQIGPQINQQIGPQINQQIGPQINQQIGPQINQQINQQQIQFSNPVQQFQRIDPTPQPNYTPNFASQSFPQQVQPTPPQIPEFSSVMPSQLLNHSQQIQQTPPYQGLPPNNPIPPNINPSNAISLINTPPNQLSIPHSNSLMTNSNINPIYIQNSLNRTPHYAPQSPSFPTIDTTKPPHTQTHQQQHQHQNQYQVLTSMQPNAKSPHLVSSMDDLSTLIPPLHMKNSAVSAPIDGAGMGHREEHHVHIDNSDEVDHQGHIHKNSQSEIFSIGSPKGILLNPVAKDGHKPHPPKEISEVGNHVNHITIQAPSFDGKLYSVY